jgi:hypothetical protein
MTRSRRPVDLPLVAYGLAAGILSVSAGELVRYTQKYVGSLADDLSLLTILAVAIVLSMTTNSVLRWLLPLRRTDSSPHS